MEMSVFRSRHEKRHTGLAANPKSYAWHCALGASLFGPPGVMLNRKPFIFGIWWRRATRFLLGMSDWRRCYSGWGVARAASLQSLQTRRKSWGLSFCSVFSWPWHWLAPPKPAEALDAFQTGQFQLAPKNVELVYKTGKKRQLTQAVERRDFWPLLGVGLRWTPDITQASRLSQAYRRAGDATRMRRKYAESSTESAW